jgi:hypothetical protein
MVLVDSGASPWVKDSSGTSPAKLAAARAKAENATPEAIALCVVHSKKYQGYLPCNPFRLTRHNFLRVVVRHLWGWGFTGTNLLAKRPATSA